MRKEPAAEPRQLTGGKAFWWRLSDNLFRRLGWYLIPIVLLGALGVTRAGDTLALYRSTGTLSALTNPLVPDQPIGTASNNFWETPAQATARIIAEQLRTDSFLDQVAERAGLGEAVENGFLPREIVRNSIWTSASGESILTVNATWDDAQTSFALVQATIAQYQDFLASTLASNATDAQGFYTRQLDVYEQDRADAEAAILAFQDEHPALATSDSPPLVLVLELERLSDALSAAETNIAATKEKIDEAELLQLQQAAGAQRSVTVIDEPQVPTAPQSTLMEQVTIVLSFLVLGVVVSAVALLVTTVLDQSVASAADLVAIDGVGLVATVPALRLAADGGRSSRRLRRRRRSGEAAA